MAWTAEKRLFAALGGVALLVVLLLPFVFRELEPDYQAAYSMDPSKKRRFAEKAAAPVVLPGPAAAAAASSAPSRGRRDLPAPPERADGPRARGRSAADGRRLGSRRPRPRGLRPRAAARPALEPGRGRLRR